MFIILNVSFTNRLTILFVLNIFIYYYLRILSRLQVVYGGCLCIKKLFEEGIKGTKK